MSSALMGSSAEPPTLTIMTLPSVDDPTYNLEDPLRSFNWEAEFSVQEIVMVALEVTVEATAHSHKRNYSLATVEAETD